VQAPVHKIHHVGGGFRPVDTLGQSPLDQEAGGQIQRRRGLGRIEADKRGLG
jgi:hypothetical protein